jgi:hypothetical protein
MSTGDRPGCAANFPFGGISGGDFNRSHRFVSREARKSPFGVDAKTNDSRLETAVSGALASSRVGSDASAMTPSRLDTRVEAFAIERADRLMAVILS